MIPKSTIDAEILYNKPLVSSMSLRVPRKHSGDEAIYGNYFLMNLVLSKPSIIKQIVPGQFILLQLPKVQADTQGILLRRPFTIFSAVPPKRDGGNASKKGGYYNTIEIMYQVVGKGTKLMSSLKPGTKLNILGPLGNGFTINRNADVSILVAGGIGIAGLYMLLTRMSLRVPKGRSNLNRSEIYLFIGAKTKKDLCLLPVLRRLTPNIIASTEDGSYGVKGLITTALEKFLHKLITHNSELIISLYVCGPAGMSQAVRKIALKYKIPAQLSLEARMACGLGLCRVCVCKTTEGWSTVCQDGPVFPAEAIPNGIL